MNSLPVFLYADRTPSDIAGGFSHVAKTFNCVVRIFSDVAGSFSHVAGIFSYIAKNFSDVAGASNYDVAGCFSCSASVAVSCPIENKLK